MTTTATLEAAPRPRTLALGIRAAGVWPIALPAAFLLAGALIGYPFSLDKPIAAERLFGLVLAGLAELSRSLFGSLM